MRPPWHRAWRALAVSLDLVAVLVALGAAAVLRFGPLGALEFSADEETLVAPWLLASPIWIAVLAAFGLYRPLVTANAVEEARRVLAAGLAAPIAFVTIGFLLKDDPSRIWVSVGTVLAIATVGGGRRLLRAFAIRQRRAGRWRTRAVVAGRTEAKRLVDTCISDPAQMYLPVATAGFEWAGLPSGGLGELDDLVRQHRASAVLVIAEDLGREEVRQAVAAADERPTSVVVLPGLDYTLAHSVQIVPVAREPGLALMPPSLHLSQRATKRTMDLVLGCVGLVLLAPLLLAIALAVRLDSRGPSLFRQRRIGLGERVFDIVKFRTMVQGAEEQREALAAANEAGGLLFKMRDDPRLTRVGRFLRRTSLDELPQLWNVVRGDMSLVGPRPLPVGDYDLPGEEAALRRRLRVRPGMTGLWQMSGRSALGSDDILRLDLTYLQSWSLLLDLYVLLRTPHAVLSKRGAS